MRKYKIFHNGIDAIAFPHAEDKSNNDIKKLLKQGFREYYQMMVADDEDEAVDKYYDIVHLEEHRPCKMYDLMSHYKNVLSFKSNDINRLEYFIYSTLVGFIAVVYLPDLYLQVLNPGLRSAELVWIMFGIVFIPVAMISLSVSVARWKDIGHNGWLYPLVFMAFGILDTLIGYLIFIWLDIYVIGFGSLIFTGYLLFKSGRKKAERIKHQPHAFGA